jgi:tetratricopeptide (TPR) repeat protein
MSLAKNQSGKGRFAKIGILVAVLGFGLVAGKRVNAEATKVTILKTDGQRETGFIQDSNDKAILFAYTEQTKGQVVDRSVIKSIFYQEETSLMGRGRQAFALGAYEPAAEIFGKIATDYEGIWALPDNFASEARFFQMESLRRLGKYEELGALLETKSGKSIAATQDKFFGEQVQLMKMWAAYAASKWDVVKAGLQFYEVPQVGDAKMLPAPVFKKMPKPTMIQLAFIRGKMYEQEKKLEHALEDYYRAFTITYGNEPALAKQAMLAALAIEAADPKMKELQSKQWQLEGLAYYFKNAVGRGEIPAEYSKYAVIPNIPVGPEPKAKEGEEKKDGDAAKEAKEPEVKAGEKAKDGEKAKQGEGEKAEGEKAGDKKGGEEKPGAKKEK